ERLKELSDAYGAVLEAVERDLKERHSGVSGFFRNIGDDVFGLPSWIVEKYERAETEFANGAIDKARELDAFVNRIIASCMKLIEDTEKEITKIFAKLGPANAAWAADQQRVFQQRLEGLRDQARNTRSEFEKQLQQSATDAARDAHDKLHEMLERNKGI